MDEVAVRAVDLQGAEPGQVRAPGGLGELVDDRGDGVGGEFVGRGDRSERDRTGTHAPQSGTWGWASDHGRPMPALRPGWLSWIAGTAPESLSAWTRRAKAGGCRSFHSPRS